MKKNINIDLISHLYEKILTQKKELSFLNEDVIKLNAKSFSKIKVLSKIADMSVNELILSDLQNVCSRLNLNVTITKVNSDISLEVGMINDKKISSTDRTSSDNLVNELKKIGYSQNSQSEKSVYFGSGDYLENIRIDNKKGVRVDQQQNQNPSISSNSQLGLTKTKKADTRYFEQEFKNKDIIKEETLLPPVPIPSWQKSNFAEKRSYEIHPGVDIHARSGTPVVSPLDGIIEVADINFNSKCGGTIDIDHGNGFWSRFCHMKKIDVKVGDLIKRGDVVGLSGGDLHDIGRGNSDGAHLHWTLKKNGIQIDALNHIGRDEADEFDITKANVSPSLKTAAGAAGGLAALSLVKKLSTDSSSDDDSIADSDGYKTVPYKEKKADTAYYPLTEQKVYSKFGEDETYYGDSILIPKEKNNKVKSPVDGKLTKLKFNLGCKNQIDIVHEINGERYYLQYCGLKELYSTRGNISRGETIGTTGDDDVIVTLYTIGNTKVPISRVNKLEKKKTSQSNFDSRPSKNDIHKSYFQIPKKKSDVLYFERKIQEQVDKIKKLL